MIPKHRIQSYVLTLLAVGFVANLMGREFRTGLAIPAAADITLTGDLRDPAWERAASPGAFIKTTGDSPAREQARVRLFYSPEYLYVGFECRQSEPPFTRDDAPSFVQDCVEVHIFDAPGGERRLQVAVSANNLQYIDARQPGVAIESQTARQADGWSCEMRIPLDAFDAAEPFLLNLGRNNLASSELSLAGVAQAMNFHDSARALPAFLNRRSAGAAVDPAGAKLVTFNTEYVFTVPVTNTGDRAQKFTLADTAVELAAGEQRRVEATVGVEAFQAQPYLLLNDDAGHIAAIVGIGPERFAPETATVTEIVAGTFRDGKLSLEAIGPERSDFRFEVSAVEDGIIRVRGGAGALPERSVTLMQANDGEYAPAEVRCVEESGHWRFSSRLGELVIAEKPFGMRLFDADGRLLAATVSDGVDLGDGFRLAMGIGEGERFYGFGSGPGAALERNGGSWLIWVEHNATGDIFFPYFISDAGFGLFSNNSFKTRFDMGERDPGRWEAAGAGGDLDVFLFVGAPKMVVEQYTRITGRPTLPPAWAFGYWQSTTRIDGQPEVLEVARRMREKAIPCDVIAQDPGWAKSFMSFRWGDSFPEPARLLEELGKNHFKLGLWTVPFVNPNVDFFQQGLDSGFFGRNREGAFRPVDWWLGKQAGLVDFTNPEAVKWWGEQLAPLMEQGVSVLKTDGGDSEVGVDFQFAAGGADALHNLYQLYFARCVYTEMARRLDGRRPCIWIRSGISGIQRYPCAWGGDQPATFAAGRQLLLGGQNVGLGGVAFWSHDLGGFSYDPTEEYYIRSVQWGLLSPLARAHGGQNEPWSWGERAEAVFTKFAKLRYRLLPYIYSIAHEANRTGIPMMRAMLLEFPGDPEAVRQPYQYMFGPALLIAPVYEYSNHPDLTAERQVYFPAGGWHDWWDGRKMAAPGYARVSVSVDRLPVYLKAGAILPLFGEDATPQYITGGSWGPHLELLIQDGADGSFTMYEDNGIDIGPAAATAIEFRREGASRHIRVAGREGSFAGAEASRNRTWLVRLRTAQAPSEVTVDGTPCPWNFDATVGEVTVAVDRAAFDMEVR